MDVSSKVNEYKNKISEIREHKKKGRVLYREMFKLRDELDTLVESKRHDPMYMLYKENINVDTSDILNPTYSKQ
jgi:hypothetical protein